MTSRAKARQLKALRAKRPPHVFQHHALHICRDGVELLPHKWYFYDYSFMRFHGPFETQEAACEFALGNK